VENPLPLRNRADKFKKEGVQMRTLKDEEKRTRRKSTLPMQLPIYMGPISIWVVLFVFAPLGIILYFSFLKAGPFGGITKTFTLENYRPIIAGKYGIIFVRSFLYALLANFLCLAIGYPLAYWIAKYGGRRKTFFISLVIIPSWTAYLIRLYAFKTLVGTNGLINALLLNLNIISTPLRILYTPQAVMIGLVYSWLPFMVLPLYASLEGLDPALWEAAVDLGATPLERFFKITLPLTKGGIIAGTILVFIPSLGDWLVPHIIGGDRVMMVGNLVAYKFIQAGDIPGGASLALFLAAIVILILFVFIKLGGEEALERML